MMTKLVIAAFLLVPLAGCSNWGKTVDKLNPVNKIASHKVEVQQGNLVTQEMLDKLKPGMTPSQVRFVLGTPLLVDPFRKDRWDYVYLRKIGKAVVEQRRVTVLFDNDRLVGVEGDVQPAVPGEAAQPAAPAAEAAKP